MSEICFIIKVFWVALAAAFAILFISKIGLRDNIVSEALDLISQLFSCDFCLSFWTAVVICFFALLVTQDPSFLVVPFVSTPITRMLI